jgi:hypothetical protein
VFGHRIQLAEMDAQQQARIRRNERTGLISGQSYHCR